MKIHIVAADLDEDGIHAAYYGEYVSLMGADSTRQQAEQRINELKNTGIFGLRIIETTLDTDTRTFLGGYDE